MKLEEARVKKALSRRALAKESGVAERTLYAIEKGEWVPRLHTIRRVCSVLGVEPVTVDEFKAAIEEALADK